MPKNNPFAKIGVPQYSTPKPAYPDATGTKSETSSSVSNRTAKAISRPSVDLPPTKRSRRGK